MPATHYDSEEAEKVYVKTDKARYVKGEEKWFILGNWNAIISEEFEDKIMGVLI